MFPQSRRAWGKPGPGPGHAGYDTSTSRSTRLEPESLAQLAASGWHTPRLGTVTRTRPGGLGELEP
jgi:hypothetical protein